MIVNHRFEWRLLFNYTIAVYIAYALTVCGVLVFPYRFFQIIRDWCRSCDIMSIYQFFHLITKSWSPPPCHLTVRFINHRNILSWQEWADVNRYFHETKEDKFCIILFLMSANYFLFGFHTNAWYKLKCNFRFTIDMIKSFFK